MSNIYDLANELSRGLREMPEYKAVVESKQAINGIVKPRLFLMTI